VSGKGWGQGDREPFTAKLPPGPHQLPREVVRDNQRRRILQASLDFFGDRGLAATTVQDLIRRAHVSRATFYEVFDDKEDCLADLHDELLGWLWEEVAGAVARTADWEAGVRVAIAKALELLSGDPRLAVVCAIEGPATRVPRVRARHQRLVEELCGQLRLGRAARPHGEDLPQILEPALVCGAIYLIGRTVVHGREPDADTLAPELAELMLRPYRV